MTDSTDIFEKASRKAFRYPSNVGLLTTEQLWHLPLTSGRNASLDNVAKAVNQELKDVTEESFVATTRNPVKGELETKLEIVKYVISVKLAEAEAARTATAKKQEKEKLLAAVERVENAELESMTKEELLAKISAL